MLAEHVWIGGDVTILKGAHIKRGSIVGARSLVTRIDHEEGSVLVSGSEDFKTQYSLGAVRYECRYW